MSGLRTVCFLPPGNIPLLVSLRKRRQRYRWSDLNYKDQGADAKNWLAKFGDPYLLSAVDADGRVGIDYGVYGVPETYVIDKAGVIRLKHNRSDHAGIPAEADPAPGCGVVEMKLRTLLLCCGLLFAGAAMAKEAAPMAADLVSGKAHGGDQRGIALPGLPE